MSKQYMDRRQEDVCSTTAIETIVAAVGKKIYRVPFDVRRRAMRVSASSITNPPRRWESSQRTDNDNDFKQEKIHAWHPPRPAQLSRSRGCGIGPNRSRTKSEAWPTPFSNATAISGCVFVCGNGGSGSNASHFCEDLGKGTLRREDFDNDRKKRLRILSLTDNTPYILAWGNDEGFDRVFVEQLKNLARPGDLLIAISGSGNSPNVLRAVRVGQPARPDDVRLHRLLRRQAAHPGPAKACTCRSTTWASSNRSI